MNDTAGDVLIDEQQATIHGLRLDLAQERHDRRRVELENRVLWRAMGYVRAGRPDRADALLDGVVPLLPAGG